MHRKQKRADTKNRNQRHDVKGEAQNVNIDPEPGKLGASDKTLEQGSDKSMEGIRQGRDRRKQGWNGTEERHKDLRK